MSEEEKIETELIEAEEALREIYMLHGFPDPSDSEGVTPKEIQNGAKRRVIALAENIRAYGKHSNACSQIPNGIDGDCTCGFLLVLEELEKLPSFA